jgi:hypothetical protein
MADKKVVYLKGIGLVPAKEVKDIKVGDVVKFKAECRSKVIEILGDKAGYRTFKVQDSHSGHYVEVKKKLTTLLPVN